MMNEVLTSQFLVVFLVVVNVFLILLLWMIVRRVSRLHSDIQSISNKPQEKGSFDSIQTDENAKLAMEKSSKILEMLEPLLVEAKNTADNFEEQIKEKRHLSKTLNDALDSRIISINLLLSRAKTLHEKLEYQQDKILEQAGNINTQPVAQVQSSQGRSRVNVIDQQQQIIDMFYRKKDVDFIAQALSIPKEEVRMVIELKEKFLAMEKTK